MQKKFNNPPIWGIVLRKDGRYVIVNTITSTVLPANMVIRRI